MLRPRPELRTPLLIALIVGCAMLGIWTVALAFSLPRVYDANHWRLAWVGFDAAMLLSIGATAWAAWNRRAVIVVFAAVSSTLLLADAWFDCTTARSRDVALSILQAVVVEIPSALVLAWVALRVLRVLWLSIDAQEAEHSVFHHEIPGGRPPRTPR